MINNGRSTTHEPPLISYKKLMGRAASIIIITSRDNGGSWAEPP